jgi:uncharacterized lipoprotein YddW (UPF0748 family)
VWVSTVNNIDFPSKPGVSVAEMKAETDAIVARCKEMGINALIVQVHPTTDAFYKSDIFPWSHFLTGEQGTAPEGGFDPLAYWIEQGHAAGMEVHAWINPYRVAHSSMKVQSLAELHESNPAVKHADWVVQYNGAEKGYAGAWYFDPGIPEVRELIIRGVAEIAEKYDLEGFHIDDYFYPKPDFEDEKTYQKYGGGKDKDDWRRDCVDELIKGMHAVAKKAGVKFGVSPSGIWMNKQSDPRGADVKSTFESYKVLYADTYKWVKEGWMDYIVPQIYWHIGFDVADYATLLPWWADVCAGTGVSLYIGMAAYRAGGDNPAFVGEMHRQLDMNVKYPSVDGHVYFTYNSLKGKTGDEIKEWYDAN